MSQKIPRRRRKQDFPWRESLGLSNSFVLKVLPIGKRKRDELIDDGRLWW
jgi:hypothetical protein